MPHPPLYDLSIPPAIKGVDPGSFAEDTVVRRLPEIARRVIVENNLTIQAANRINLLAADMPHGLIRPLTDTGAPDALDWVTWSDQQIGKTWLEAPWFFVEEYFYRRVLEAVGYFEQGLQQGVDPYLYQKELGLKTAWKDIEALCSLMTAWETHEESPAGLFTRLLLVDVWGNRSDMSIWHADEQEAQFGALLRHQREGLLVDETDCLEAYLQGRGGRLRRVDILVDNAGFELVCDLMLVSFILHMGITEEVHLHLKPYPVFVSDAMEKDVLYTLEQLINREPPEVKRQGLRLREALSEGRIVLHADRFWISPLPGWEMPQSLLRTFEPSDLIISKGDANYRRLLGDCHWDFTQSFQQIVSYLPAPLVALRVCKSEIITGLDSEQIVRLNHTEPGWLTNAKHAVIQFAPGAGFSG